MPLTSNNLDPSLISFGWITSESSLPVCGENLSNERMKQYQVTVGPSMINRSMDHVHFILKRVHGLLFEKTSWKKQLE